jgi:hypothetical protein
MKRLVELDQETMYAKEVDVKRLKREAKVLRDYLLALPSERDDLALRQRILPFCDAAMAETLHLPLDVRDKPINVTRILDMGGDLPPGFEDLYSNFFVVAVGGDADVAHPIYRDGKVFAWMEFED